MHPHSSRRGSRRARCAIDGYRSRHAETPVPPRLEIHNAATTHRSNTTATSPQHHPPPAPSQRRQGTDIVNHSISHPTSPPPSNIRKRSSDVFLAATVALAALVCTSATATTALAQGFPSIPTCGDCPPIADDPAKMCDDALGWAFSFDPTKRVPDQPGGTPIEDLFNPVTHAFDVWVFLGASGLATPNSCTPATCLYQHLPKGAFTKKKDGVWEYVDPTAHMGAPNFIRKIGIRDRVTSMHVAVYGDMETPNDGHVSLVLTQLGNDVVTPGDTVTEPTLSFGIDRRHDAWSPKACGFGLKDSGGEAPNIFCAPDQCDQPPPEICAKRKCLFAAEIRAGRNGAPGTVELHVAFSRTVGGSIANVPITLTLQKTNAPAETMMVASLAPGQMTGKGKSYHYRGSNLRVAALERGDGFTGLDVIRDIMMPPLTEQDTLVMTLTVGPDSFNIPTMPQHWGKNANGNLVIVAGDGGLPLCPR